jgi:hypothetical protein
MATMDTIFNSKTDEYEIVGDSYEEIEEIVYANNQDYDSLYVNCQAIDTVDSSWYLKIEVTDTSDSSQASTVKTLAHNATATFIGLQTLDISSLSTDVYKIKISVKGSSASHKITINYMNIYTA